jgi:hypothetical protein
MNFASQLQDYRHQPRCPAYSPALLLSHNDAEVPVKPEIPWRVSIPSTIKAQCSLTSMFEWELVYPKHHSLLSLIIEGATEKVFKFHTPVSKHCLRQAPITLSFFSITKCYFI